MSIVNGKVRAIRPEIEAIFIGWLLNIFQDSDSVLVVVPNYSLVRVRGEGFNQTIVNETRGSGSYNWNACICVVFRCLKLHIELIK